MAERSGKTYHRVMLHRTTDKNDRRRGGHVLPSRERRSHHGLAWTVEDEPDRTVVVVVRDKKHDRPVEVRIRQQRVGHEQPAGLYELDLHDD